MKKDNKDFILTATKEDIESIGKLTHFRIESYILSNLYLMKKKNELPIGNIDRLAKIICEYHRKYGTRDTLKESDSVWELTPKYITNLKIKRAIKIIAAEHGTPFGYYRPNNAVFKGMWIFLNKDQLIEIKNNERKGMNTELETSNQEILALNKLGWNIPLPSISKVPLIGEGNSNKIKLISNKKKGKK